MQTVTTLNDSGAGSLRAAIAAAAVGEEITFSVSGTITITGTALAITQSVIITGPGMSTLAVSRTSGSGLVFNITGGVNTISGLTISGGSGNAGGNFSNTATTTV